jgi:cholest-4-en-3-one 26-monooxygenase
MEHLTLGEIDLIEEQQYADGVPFEQFALLRRECPVFWHEEPAGPGFWALTTHRDVATVSRDNQSFSSAQRGAHLHEIPEERLIEERKMLIHMDPPAHTRYRRLVTKSFTPRIVKQLEGRTRQMTDQTLDAVAERGECDFVEDIAAELPLLVICELVGIPRGDRRLIFDWSNHVIGAGDPEFAKSIHPGSDPTRELYDFCLEFIAEKRASPSDDLMSDLVHAEIAGERLTDTELFMFFKLLAVAGNETTRQLISHGQLALMEHPEQRAKLAADPGLIALAVEEMLRCSTPTMLFRRTATSDLELGGQAIKAGDKVVMYYISANRDEQVFVEPDRFKVDRDPNPQVAFGAGGLHHCLGANLARLEAKVMFEALAARMPDMAQSGPAERLRSRIINGIKHLPVAYTPSHPIGA